MKEEKESKEKFRTKKVNHLSLAEAIDLKSFMEKTEQQNSLKYQHVIWRIMALS